MALCTWYCVQVFMSQFSLPFEGAAATHRHYVGRLVCISGALHTSRFVLHVAHRALKVQSAEASVSRVSSYVGAYCAGFAT